MYDIPETATLLKEGLYVDYYTYIDGYTQTRLYAGEGYAIYYIYSEEEEERQYYYRVYLAVNDSVENYDVCLVTPDMEVVGKPKEEEII